jgi:hypothetical protein
MIRRSATAKKFRAQAPISKKSGLARSHYLLAQVTPEEKLAILRYCKSHNLSVSGFLAQVAIQDARAKKKSGQEQPLTITINLPASKRAKLLYTARLKEKSIDRLVEEMIAPSLAKNRRGPGARYTLKTEALRYYLNDEEHALIKKHMEKEHLSSRHYLAQLALQAIEQRGPRRAPKR